MIYTLTLNPAVDMELQVQAFELNQVSRAVSSQIDAGGKGFNVSRMLCHLDVANVAMGFVGGHNGARLQDELNKVGVQTDFTSIDGETRTNVSFVRANSSDHYKVNEAGPSISDTELAQLFEKVSETAKSGDWWVLAGSVPPGVSTSVYADLIAVLKQAGAHTILDTSGEALVHGCAAGPSLIKPNLEEALELLNLSDENGLSHEDICRKLTDLGPEAVVISMGKTGACCFSNDTLQLIHSPVIEEKNPVGAGDSLVAGLVWGLSLDESLPDALTKGVACGAATASQAGTTLGSQQQVEQLLATL